MKKTFSVLKRGVLGLLIALAVVSCGTKIPTDKEVAAKIDAKEQLTEADYTTMIDYCGKYAEQAQQYYNIINAQPNDSTAEYIKASDDLANLYGSYVYLDAFRQQIAQTDMTTLGKDNENKVNEYAKYQGFPLPGGAGADLQDPNVVGMIEQMPSTAATDSTGILSTGDGEAVDVKVK